MCCCGLFLVHGRFRSPRKYCWRPAVFLTAFDSFQGKEVLFEKWFILVGPEMAKVVWSDVVLFFVDELVADFFVNDVFELVFCLGYVDR